MDNQNLSEFECHFTWDFINLEKRTKRYLWDRINIIEKEFSSQNEGSQQIKRNFPRLYSLRGYLYVQLYEKTEDGGKEFLDKAETSFKEALKECKDENVGYRTIIYADLIHFENKWRRRDATEFIRNYRGLFQDVKNHPEILAMKGYAASLFYSCVKAIEFYERAISKKKTADWIFGLALATQRRNSGRSAQNEPKEIEDLFREVLRLDPTNDMARLKLATQLWNNIEKREENKEDIDHLLEGVNTSQDNTTLLVKKAALLCKIHPNTEQEETLLTKALVKYPNSNEILRGLGHVYIKRWHADKTDESNLEEAIKYFTMIVDKESINDMHFDLTMIGYVHLQASNYYRYKKIMCEERKHSEKLKKWMEKAEERLSKEQYDLKSSIETSYRLSQYYKYKSELEQEKRYLRDTLIKANEGSEEDKFQELKYFIEAKLRLLEVANYYSDETEISWVYEQSYEFDKAIDHFQKAMSKCWDESKHKDMYEREALLLSKQVEKEMKNDNKSQSFDEFNEKVEQLHDCEIKWNLTFEIRRIKIEKLMSGDQNLRELKEKSLQFEVCLSDLHKCNVETEEWHIEERKTNKKIFAVVRSSKTILDHSVNYISEKLYPNKGRSGVNYPRASELEGKNEKSRKVWFEKSYYTPNKWTEFCKKYVTISNFLVQRLDVGKYEFLVNFIALRNIIAHKPEKNQIAFLNKEYPNLLDKIEFVRKSSEYAVDVLRFITREVDLAEQRKDNETDQATE